MYHTYMKLTLSVFGIKYDKKEYDYIVFIILWKILHLYLYDEFWLLSSTNKMYNYYKKMYPACLS